MSSEGWTLFCSLFEFCRLLQSGVMTVQSQPPSWVQMGVTQVLTYLCLPPQCSFGRNGKGWPLVVGSLPPSLAWTVILTSPTHTSHSCLYRHIWIIWLWGDSKGLCTAFCSNGRSRGYFCQGTSAHSDRKDSMGQIMAQGPCVLSHW